MADFRETVMARWGHVQSYLFPWMREEFDPCSEALERLIIVLDTIGLEAFVPPPRGGGRGRKPDDRRVVARPRPCCPYRPPPLGRTPGHRPVAETHLRLGNAAGGAQRGHVLPGVSRVRRNRAAGADARSAGQAHPW